LERRRGRGRRRGRRRRGRMRGLIPQILHWIAIDASFT
jgi:hypothetical protein